MIFFCILWYYQSIPYQQCWWLQYFMLTESLVYWCKTKNYKKNVSCHETFFILYCATSLNGTNERAHMANCLRICLFGQHSLSWLYLLCYLLHDIGILLPPEPSIIGDLFNCPHCKKLLQSPVVIPGWPFSHLCGVYFSSVCLPALFQNKSHSFYISLGWGGGLVSGFKFETLAGKLDACLFWVSRSPIHTHM